MDFFWEYNIPLYLAATFIYIVASVESKRRHDLKKLKLKQELSLKEAK